MEVWECECGRECADESREDIYRVGLGRLHPVASLQFEMNILLHYQWMGSYKVGVWIEGWQRRRWWSVSSLIRWSTTIWPVYTSCTDHKNSWILSTLALHTWPVLKLVILNSFEMGWPVFKWVSGWESGRNICRRWYMHFCSQYTSVMY